MRHIAPFSTTLLLFTLAAAAQNPPRPPRPPGPGGPYFHQVMSASSDDGLAWTHDNRILLEHASVPAAIITPHGRVRLYYVDASTIPEGVNCAESEDGGVTFAVLDCTIDGRGEMKAVDPSIVLLPDGTYRLYYYGMALNGFSERSRHTIYSARSEDGIHFTRESEAYFDDGLVDPDVFWSGRDWLMFVMSLAKPGTVIAKSDDGVTFSYLGMLDPQGWGTTAPVRLEDGRLRLYAFDQGKQTTVRSWTSINGINWTQEDGIRLTAPEGKELTDPFVVELPSGGWKMFYKVSAAPPRP